MLLSPLFNRLEWSCIRLFICRIFTDPAQVAYFPLRSPVFSLWPYLSRNSSLALRLAIIVAVSVDKVSRRLGLREFTHRLECWRYDSSALALLTIPLTIGDLFCRCCLCRRWWWWKTARNHQEKWWRNVIEEEKERKNRIFINHITQIPELKVYLYLTIINFKTKIKRKKERLNISSSLLVHGLQISINMCLNSQMAMWAMQKRRWWKIATQHNTAMPMPRLEKEFSRKYIPARAIPISHLASLFCGKPMRRWAIAIDAEKLSRRWRRRWGWAEDVPRNE